MSKNRPFAITILMADGHPDGVKEVTKDGWDGVGVVCPRVRYFQEPNRPEFKRNCVYILIGDMVDIDKPQIYIGKTKLLGNRLTQHAKKDWWNQVVVFASKSDDELNIAHIGYLESKLYGKAKDNKRCDLQNIQEPKPENFSKNDKTKAELYLGEMLSLLLVLNIRVFEGVPIKGRGRKIYFFKSKKFEASGYETNNSFVVQKGSTASVEVMDSLQSFTKKKRLQIIESNIMVKSGDLYRFEQDYEFNSSSEAARVICGYSVSGFEAWKDTQGVKLKNSKS